MTSTHAAKRNPGRPREFDMDAALDAAVQVFRDRGYHAASVADLSKAMGLTAGSLYKAFADKRAIFLAAYSRYTMARHAGLRAAMGLAATGLDKIKVLLDFYVASSSGSEGQLGCLVAGSATALSTFDPEMAQAVRDSVHQLEAVLEAAILTGQQDGSVAPAIDARACACALLCLVQGFRIVGKVGYGEPALRVAADQMLRSLS